MDPTHVFRQGLGSVAPRQPNSNTLSLPRRPMGDDLSDDHGDGAGGRIAHTLTACCRCRQVGHNPSLLIRVLPSTVGHRDWQP
jgi:hypothetical protein